MNYRVFVPLFVLMGILPLTRDARGTERGLVRGTIENRTILPDYCLEPKTLLVMDGTQNSFWRDAKKTGPGRWEYSYHGSELNARPGQPYILNVNLKVTTVKGTTNRASPYKGSLAMADGETRFCVMGNEELQLILPCP